MVLDGRGPFASKPPPSQTRFAESCGPKTFIAQYTVLKRPRCQEALELLRRVGALVRPIMHNHGWKLPLLAEFFPRNERLLGINVGGGHKISLRLRPASSPESFYDVEHLVGTMLHELTHNVRGPHDSVFYELLDKLQDEYDEVRRNGWVGEGFLTPGVRLGDETSYNVPLHLARQKAFAAAEKRRRVQELMKGGGRLGEGGRRQTATDGKSMRELIAEAAERRRKDEKECPSASEDLVEEVEREMQRDAADTGVIVIDIIGDEGGGMGGDGDVLVRDKPGRIEEGMDSSGMEAERADELDSETDEKADSRTRTRGSNVVSQSATLGVNGKKKAVGSAPPRVTTAKRPSPDVIVISDDDGDDELTKRRSAHPNSEPKDLQHSIQARGDNARSSARPGMTSKPARIVPAKRPSSAPSPEGKEATSRHPVQQEWTCQTCTLVNKPSSTECDACLAPRHFAFPTPTGRSAHVNGRLGLAQSNCDDHDDRPPGPHGSYSKLARLSANAAQAEGEDQGWLCSFCGVWEPEESFWTCRACGSVKTSSAGRSAGAVLGGGGARLGT